MNYYEDYEAYASVYEDIDYNYDVDKDIEEMLDYNLNLYNADFELVFSKGE